MPYVMDPASGQFYLTEDTGGAPPSPTNLIQPLPGQTIPQASATAQAVAGNPQRFGIAKPAQSSNDAPFSPVSSSGGGGDDEESVGSAFGRGVGNDLRGLKQAGYGLASMAGSATNIDSLRDWGRQKMEEVGQDIQASSRDSDSFSTVMDGNGSKVNFAAYWAGQAVSELAQAVVTGGVGSILAKTAAKKGVTLVTEAAIKKEAAELAGKAAGENATADQVAQLAASQEIQNAATQNVVSTMGQTVALGADAWARNMGSIYNDATNNLKPGEDLTGGQLARIAGAAFAAAIPQTFANHLGVERLLVGGGTGGIARRVAAGAASQGAVQGITAFGTTALSRWGSGQMANASDVGHDIQSNWREYLDSLMSGVVGGAAVGAAGGVHKTSEGQAKPAPEAEENPGQQQQGEVITSTMPGERGAQVASELGGAPAPDNLVTRTRSSVEQPEAVNDPLHQDPAANSGGNEDGPPQAPAGGVQELEGNAQHALDQLREPQRQFNNMMTQQDRAESEAPRPTEPGSLPAETGVKAAQDAVPTAPGPTPVAIDKLGVDPVGTVVKLVDPTAPMTGQVGVITSPEHIWIGGTNFKLRDTSRFVKPDLGEAARVPRTWVRMNDEELAQMRTSPVKAMPEAEMQEQPTPAEAAQPQAANEQQAAPAIAQPNAREKAVADSAAAQPDINGKRPNPAGAYAPTETLALRSSKHGVADAEINLTQLADGTWTYGRGFWTGRTGEGHAPSISTETLPTREAAVAKAANEISQRVEGRVKNPDSAAEGATAQRIQEWARSQRDKAIAKHTDAMKAAGDDMVEAFGQKAKTPDSAAAEDAASEAGGKTAVSVDGQTPQGETRKAEFRMDKGRLKGVALHDGDGSLVDFVRARKGDTIKAMSDRIRDRFVPQGEVDAKNASKKMASDNAARKNGLVSDAKIERLKEKMTGDKADISPEAARQSELAEGKQTKKDSKAKTQEIADLLHANTTEEQRFNASMQDKYGLPAKSYRFADAPDDLSKIKASNIEKIFPVKVQFVEAMNEHADALMEGAYVPGVSKDTVYISTRTQNPFMFVAGHEFAHSIKARNPKLWSAFISRVSEQGLIDAPVFKKQFEEMYARERGAEQQRIEAGEKVNRVAEDKLRSKIMEEIHADLIGSMLLKPEFLQKLAATAKPEARTVISKIVDALQQYLSDLKAKISSRGLRGGKAFKDVVQTEREVADLINRFSDLKDSSDETVRADAEKFWNKDAASEISYADLGEKLQQRWHDIYSDYRDGDINGPELTKEIASIERAHGENQKVERQAQLSQKSEATPPDDEPKLSEKAHEPEKTDLDFTDEGNKQSLDFTKPDVPGRDRAAFNPQVNTPEFKSWFGHSQVVDEFGDPKVMYHGTAQDIRAFRAKQAKAIFVSEDPAFAEGFSGMSREWMENHVNEVLKPDELRAAKEAAIATVKYAQASGRIDAAEARERIYRIGKDKMTATGSMDQALIRQVAARMPSGENIMPVYVRAEHPFDFANKGDVNAVMREIAKNHLEIGKKALREVTPEQARDYADSFRAGLERGSWNAIEGHTVQQGIRDAGFDGFHVLEAGRKNLAVYDPNQIKSATGNRGTFSTEDDDVSLSRKGPEFDAKKNPTLAAAVQKMGFNKETPSLRDRVTEIATRAKKEAVQGIFDRYRRIKDYSKEAYVRARMSDTYSGAVSGLVLNGRVGLDGDNHTVQFHDGGLLDVLRSVKGEGDQLLLWIAGNRAKRLMAEGRENNLNGAEIAELTKLNQGKMADGTDRATAYREALAKLNGLNKSVLDYSHGTGLINRDTYNKLVGDTFYVPFYREMTDGDGFEGPTRVASLVGQKAFETLKGRNMKTSDLLENIVMNWTHLLGASMHNQAAVETLKAAEQMGAARRVTSDFKDGVKVMVNGKTEHYEITDPLLTASIQSLTPTAIQTWAKPLAKMRVWFTRGVTLAPGFKVRNLIRDTVTTLGVSPVNPNFVKNVWDGFHQTGDEKFSADLLSGGGSFKFGTFDEGNAATHIRRLTDMGVDKRSVMDIRNAGDFMSYLAEKMHDYQEFGDRFENANRAALYTQLRNQGISHFEASYHARDLMDFGLAGSWSWVRTLTTVVPFLNARLQGLYKIGRAFDGGEQAKRMATVIGAVSLASAGLYALWKDDPDFQQREQWDRDTYWWFKVGDTAFRIPKPFEIGSIGTVAERTLEQFADDNADGSTFLQSMKNILSDNFALNPVPQAVRPLFDVYANQNPFTQRPIESDSMQRLPKEERYNAYTSMPARGLGMVSKGVSDATGGLVPQLSPTQIDYLANGYFGWMGATAADAGDLIARQFTNNPTPDSKKILGLPEQTFLGFAKNLPSEQSRYVTSFYQQHQQLQQLTGLMSSLKSSGDYDRLSQLQEDNQDQIGLAKQYDKASQSLSKISAQIRRVQADPEMSGADKREELNDLYARRNEIAKDLEERRVETKRGG